MIPGISYLNFTVNCGICQLSIRHKQETHHENSDGEILPAVFPQNQNMNDRVR